ncbi:MAG: STAS domain-containing protein [Planctomycetota bacterium]|jgi:anti-anti-sigma regulatory factor
MWIENATDHTYVLYTPVSQEPGLQHELKTINQIVGDRDDCNVIISLADIEILTSSTISQLLELHNSLSEHGRMLILCKVGLPIKGIFRIEGLSSVFNLAADMWDAQEVIQKTARSELQHAAD